VVASFVVLDSLMREVVRQNRPAVSSECEPNLQAADFLTELPPGEYRIGLAVRDGSGRRGVERYNLTVDPPRVRLELSDVVVTCGVPTGEAAPVLPAIAANVGARVGASDPLTAYFEIHDLAIGADGRSRFQYEYAVRWAVPDTRTWIQRVLSPRPGPAPIVATRDEVNEGTIRRQFVSVPLGSMPGGRYRLEIKVVDLLTGEEARGAVEFERAGAVP
jgi:hypothetical protein